MIMDGCNRPFSLQSCPSLPVGEILGCLRLCFLHLFYFDSKLILTKNDDQDDDIEFADSANKVPITMPKKKWNRREPR